MVGLVRHYSNRPDLLVDLEHTARNLQRALGDPVEASVSVRRQPNPGAGPSRQRVSARLTETDINALVAEFQDGAPAWVLAGRYRIALSSVKSILREHKARPSDLLGREPGVGSEPDRRMSRMVAEIVRAREDGRLPERFRATDIRRACPGWAENTYRTVLPDHRVGNPGGRTPYFVRHSDGWYSLCDCQVS